MSHDADLVSKSAALKVTIGGKPVHIGGMCKGSGMIHPNMATMLGVVTSDANVTPEAWTAMVKRASTASFNQITVSAARCCCRLARPHSIARVAGPGPKRGGREGGAGQGEGTVEGLRSLVRE